MKKLKLLLLIISFAFTSNGLFAQKEYDDFFKRLELEKIERDFVNKFIDNVVKSRNERQNAKWQQLKNSIDYKPLMNELKAVIKKGYTLAEVRAILAANKNTDTFIYKSKPEMVEKVYQISKRFGETLTLKISSFLGENVLDPVAIRNFKGLNLHYLTNFRKYNRWKIKDQNYKFINLFCHFSAAGRDQSYKETTPRDLIAANIIAEKKYTTQDLKELQIPYALRSLFFKNEKYPTGYTTRTVYSKSFVHRDSHYYYLSNTSENFSYNNYLRFWRNNNKDNNFKTKNKFKYLIEKGKTFEILNKLSINVTDHYPGSGYRTYIQDHVALKNVSTKKILILVRDYISIEKCFHIKDKSCKNKKGFNVTFDYDICKCNYTSYQVSANKTLKILKKFCKEKVWNTVLHEMDPFEYLTNLELLGTYIKYNNYQGKSDSQIKADFELSNILSGLKNYYFTDKPTLSVEEMNRIFRIACMDNYTVSKSFLQRMTAN